VNSQDIYPVAQQLYTLIIASLQCWTGQPTDPTVRDQLADTFLLVCEDAWLSVELRAPSQQRPDRRVHPPAPIAACGIAIQAVHDLKGGGITLIKLFDDGHERDHITGDKEHPLREEIPRDPAGAHIAPGRTRAPSPLRVEVNGL
jgi:hypothetical protein